MRTPEGPIVTHDEKTSSIIWGYIGLAIGLAVGLVLCGTGHV